MNKVDEALDAIEKYIENGSPLPSTDSPYWKASESVPIARSELARLRVERDELLAALARIVGMCGEVDRCKCGRPTGIAAITTCARAALSRTEGGEVGE